MKRILSGALIGASLAALTLATDAVAEPVARCSDLLTMRAVLADEAGEESHWFGIDDDGLLVELFTNVDTGTWTLTVTAKGAPTCIVGMGTASDGVIREPVPGAGEPM